MLYIGRLVVATDCKRCQLQCKSGCLGVLTSASTTGHPERIGAYVLRVSASRSYGTPAYKLGVPDASQCSWNYQVGYTENGVWWKIGLRRCGLLTTTTLHTQQCGFNKAGCCARWSVETISPQRGGLNVHQNNITTQAFSK